MKEVSGYNWYLPTNRAVILIILLKHCHFHAHLEHKCNGYTWHGELSNRISNVCVLFDTTSPDGSYECSNCISGQINEIEENCNCQKQYGGECLITNNNFLSAIVAYSDLECFIQCSATDGCSFYTWYRSVEFLLVFFDEIDSKFLKKLFWL